VVVVVMVLVFAARRVWRYPLFLIGGTVLVGLGLGYSWWALTSVLAGLAVAGGLWAWQHPIPSTGSQRGRCGRSGVARWCARGRGVG
jgi:hypothetical protein